MPVRDADMIPAPQPASIFPVCLHGDWRLSSQNSAAANDYSLRYQFTMSLV